MRVFPVQNLAPNTAAASSSSERYFAIEHEKSDLLEASDRLIHEKIQMVSLKEAIVGAIDELRTADVAFGCDLSQSGSRRATDIIGGAGAGSVPSQWLSAREQVAMAVYGESAELTALHSRCCNRVKVQCDTFYELRARYLLSEGNRSPDSISVASSASDSHSTVPVVDHETAVATNHTDSGALELSSLRRVKTAPNRTRQSRRNR